MEGRVNRGFLRYEFGGLIFGGAYTWRGLFSEFHGPPIVGRKFTVFALFCFVFEGNFQVQAPGGGSYLEGRFNEGVFALRVWGAYIWRGLFLQFYGISIKG